MSVIRCKHCPESTRSTLDAARMLGWRVWSGTTVGGKLAEDVVCPACAGTAPQDMATDKPAGWGVRCNTCDWMFEDEYDEGPLSARAAKYMAREHECEPDVEVSPPNSKDWHDPWFVNDDGSVKDLDRPLARVGGGTSDA